MKPEEVVVSANLQERLALARSLDTADEILMLLAQDKKLDVRRALADRKGRSDQLMQLLVNDKSKDIRLRMAKYPELRTEFQEQLAMDKETSIRVALARRNDLPERLLLMLAASHSPVVGIALAGREILSDELLNFLITHRSKNVRIALAKRAILSDTLFAALIEDDNPDVVSAISRREELSIERIEKLSHYNSKQVRAVIASRIDLPKKVVEILAMYDKSIDDLLSYIEKACKTRLTIKGHKLVFHTRYRGEESGLKENEKLAKLLPLVFAHPSFRKVYIIEINPSPSWDDAPYPFSYDQAVASLSSIKVSTRVKKLSLFTDYFDLSQVTCGSLGPINKQIFPKLKILSMECELDMFKLDLPELKEISIKSSGNGFHKLLLMLINSNLPSLETISISAGYYSSDYPFKNRKVKLYLENAHEVWPNLKSLSIGARYAYDWGLLLSSPLFRQLSNLVIELEDPDGSAYDKYDDYTDECTTILCKSIVALIDTLIEQPDYLLNIESITVGIGQGINDGIGELIIDKEKIARLKQLYNFNIQYDAFVGGYE